MKTNFITPTRLIALVSIAVLFFVATGCNKSQNESAAAFDLTRAKKEIEEANQHFMESLSKGDSVGVAECYATDAKFMGPNAPAIGGKQNIQAVASSLIRAGITNLELKATEVWGTDEIITEEGEFTLASKDGKPLDKGKYIVVWKKEDGKWKLFRDMFNSNLPPPAAK